MRRSITLLLAMTLLAVALAACGGGGDAGEPTDVPPAAEAVAPSGDLSEQYVAPNAEVQLNHPEGWVPVENAGVVQVGNSREAIFAAGSPDALRTSQVVMTIMVLTNILGNDADVVTVLPANVALAMPPGRTMDMGTEATAVELGGRAGARMQGSDGAFTSIAYLVDVGAGRRVLVAAWMRNESVGEFESTIMAIAGTVSYLPAQ